MDATFKEWGSTTWMARREEFMQRDFFSFVASFWPCSTRYVATIYLKLAIRWLVFYNKTALQSVFNPLPISIIRWLLVGDIIYVFYVYRWRQSLARGRGFMWAHGSSLWPVRKIRFMLPHFTAHFISHFTYHIMSIFNHPHTCCANYLPHINVINHMICNRVSAVCIGVLTV
jgi:hypothetical protein